MKMCKNCKYLEDYTERSGECTKKHGIRKKDAIACELFREKQDVGKDILSMLHYIASELEQIKKTVKKCYGEPKGVYHETD